MGHATHMGHGTHMGPGKHMGHGKHMVHEGSRAPQHAESGPGDVKGRSDEVAALWSAISSERRALDERTTAGGGRCGWPLQDETREALRPAIASIRP